MDEQGINVADVAREMHTMPRDLTRREVLHYGAATGLAATWGGYDVHAQTATNTPADLIIYTLDVYNLHFFKSLKS